MIKNKFIFLFLLLLTISSCKKEEIKIKEIGTIDEHFYLMKDYDNANYQSYSLNGTKSSISLIDSVINEIKLRDGIYKFSGKLVKQMGIPYWDYSMKVKNENGNHTLITPILDSNKNVENLFFHTKIKIKN